MAQVGDSGDALEEARRLLAARDADLGDADRALAEAVADAHAIAAASVGRLEAIESDIAATVSDSPRDTAAGAREMSRHLVAKNREIAAVLSEAKDAIDAKTIVLKQLAERYRLRSLG